MIIGSIDWGAHEGEELEKVMAVLIQQTRPRSNRRTPSQGDGGVDIYNPIDGGYEVFQVKKFAARLTNNQKGQIKKSLEDAIADPRLGAPITDLYMTVPLDPTSGEQAWFDELITVAPFRCVWRGKTFWDSMAAAHPGVIDYFFRDGKSRLEAKITTLSELFAGAPTRPGDLLEPIQRLRAQIDEADPFYSYDLSVTADLPALGARPGVVFTHVTGTEDRGYVRIDVRPKYPDALLDNPIGGSLALVLHDPERGIDQVEEFRTFVEFGREVRLVPGSISRAELAAPGGLSATLTEAEGVLARELPHFQPYNIEMDILAPDRSSLSHMVVRAERGSYGASGFEITGSESHGVFDFTLQLDIAAAIDQRAAAQWNFRMNPITGTPIRTVVPALKFFLNMREPNMLRQRFDIPALLDDMRETAIPAGLLPPTDGFDFLEWLDELQKYTSSLLSVPPYVTKDEYRSAERAYRIIKGETVKTPIDYAEMDLPVSSLPDLRRGTEEGNGIENDSSFGFFVAGSTYPLGTVTRVFYGATITSEEITGDMAHVILSAPEGWLEERLIGTV